jgi:hypothetical protein
MCVGGMAFAAETIHSGAMAAVVFFFWPAGTKKLLTWKKKKKALFVVWCGVGGTFDTEISRGGGPKLRIRRSDSSMGGGSTVVTGAASQSLLSPTYMIGARLYLVAAGPCPHVLVEV